MRSFSEWIIEFFDDDLGFLGVLSSDIKDDINFPADSKSLEEIVTYVSNNWGTCYADETYLKNLKDIFKIYEKGLIV